MESRTFRYVQQPAQVTGLAVSATTSSSVSLSWNAVSGATYRVYRNGSQVGTPAGTTYTDSGLSPSTSYTYTVAAVINTVVGAQSASVLAMTGGGASTYTATHYVAPWQQVAGASNDYTDLGATSWANAARGSGDAPLVGPTTLGTAMARAQAGDQVRCAVGVLEALCTNERYVPAFRPANSGTPGNHIVFFSENRASTETRGSAYYTEIRSNAYYNWGSPAFGVTGRNYVIFDGFYFKMSTAYPARDGGSALLHTSNGCEFRGLRIDCDFSNGDTGYNFNPVRIASAQNSAIRDCLFTGNIQSHANGSNITVYSATGLDIANNTFNCIPNGTAIFIKGAENSVYSSNVRIYLNRTSNGRIMAGNVDEADIYNNLVVADNGMGDSRWAAFYYYPDMSNIRVYNNTVVGSATYISGAMWADQPGTHFGTQSRFYDNIVSLSSGTYCYLQVFNNAVLQDGGITFTRTGSNAEMAERIDRLDGNVYYQAGGALRFSNAVGTPYASLSEWSGALASPINMRANARETNSIGANPLFVGGGDYRLQAGSPARAGVGGRTTTAGCYITGTEEIGVRASPTY